MFAINTKIKEAAEEVVKEHKRIVKETGTRDWPHGNPSPTDWDGLSERIADLGDELD